LKEEEYMLSKSAIRNAMSYHLNQDFTCSGATVWGLVYKFTCICYRSIDRIFDIIYWPVISLLLWGFTSTFISTTSSSVKVLEFFLGGTVLWSLFWRAQTDVGTFILEDFWSRNIYNLFAAPVTPLELFCAIGLIGVVRCLLSFIFLGLLAWLLYAFNILLLGGIAIAIFTTVLMLFGWVVGIVVAALIFRYGLRIQVLAWSVGFIIEPFSCVFYPLESMPRWVQMIAMTLPTTYVFEGFRHAIATGELALQPLLIALGLTLGLLLAAFWFFQYALQQAKKQGLLTRFEMA
jgi:ABC-2 type transport system permease protein